MPDISNPNAEMVAMASLPGLKFSLDQSLEALNNALRIVGMPQLAIIRADKMRVEAPHEAPQKALPPASIMASVKTEPPAKKKMSKALRRKIGERAKEYWQTVQAAGIKRKNGSLIPDKETYLKAKKILARRSKKAAIAAPVAA